jgi:hypothetical protein
MAHPAWKDMTAHQKFEFLNEWCTSGLNATVESGIGFPRGSRRESLGDAHWDRRRSDRR